MADGNGAARGPGGSQDGDGLVAKLRDEILESQKARAELTKWKVILIAAIGGAAIGLGGKEGLGGASGMPILFSLLPPACLYVDLLCMHNDIRMMVIGHFLRTRERGDVAAYEALCDKLRHVFGLESLALTGVTMLVAALVAVIGFALVPIPSSSSSSASEGVREVLIVSSSAVVAGSALLALWRAVRLKDIASETPRGWTWHMKLGALLCVLGGAVVAVLIVPGGRSRYWANVAAVIAALLVSATTVRGVRDQSRQK